MITLYQILESSTDFAPSLVVTIVIVLGTGDGSKNRFLQFLQTIQVNHSQVPFVEVSIRCIIGAVRWKNWWVGNKVLAQIITWHFNNSQVVSSNLVDNFTSKFVSRMNQNKGCVNRLLTVLWVGWYQIVYNDSHILELQETRTPMLVDSDACFGCSLETSFTRFKEVSRAKHFFRRQSFMKKQALHSFHLFPFASCLMFLSAQNVSIWCDCRWTSSSGWWSWSISW